MHRRIAPPLAPRGAAVVATAALAVVGCAPRAQRPPRAAPPAQAQAPTAARARLVVLLVIDQLPSWGFARDRPLFTGGLARLLREGAVVADAELPYVNTFTAPGHATIATGAPPAVHGILGNQWYRRPLADGARALPAEHDPAAPSFAIGDAAAATLDTASGAALRVDGLAEALRAASGGRARSAAVGLKARAACLIAGRRPDAAVWFDADAGGMTTSRAYADEAPAWLHAHARARPAARDVGATWTPLDAALLARATGVADARPGEGDVHGLGVAFPHPIREPEAIVHSPFGDALVLDAADAAIDALALGADATPDLLAISLNAHDYIGHAFGPESWELLDATLRLDRQLAAWLAALDRRFGADGWALVLTSDHGATPLPEGSAAPGARRIPPRELEAAAEAALAARLGGGPWVLGTTANMLYLRAPFAALPAAARDAALADAAAAVGAVPGVARALPLPALLAGCGAGGGPAGGAGGGDGGGDELARAACLGLAPDLAGELLVVPARGSTITSYATGTHHDAPNDDNRRVPIVVRAPGLRPQAGAGTLLQVAPTVAALLGVPAPPASTAPPLFGLPPARSEAPRRR